MPLITTQQHSLAQVHQGLIFVWGESGPSAEHESAASAIHGSNLLDELGGEVLDPHNILIVGDKNQQRGQSLGFRV